MKTKNIHLTIVTSGLLFFFGLAPDTFVRAETNIEMSFTSQAPEGDWHEPWQNACEEAAIAVVDYFYQNETFDSVAEAKKEIESVLSLKESLFGTSKDESLATMTAVINRLDNGWTARRVLNPTVKDIIAEIDAGRPVIFPLYARMIENPYYTPPGPTYHMIVISGYDDEHGQFIVKDVGTRHGNNLRFRYEELMAANFDLSLPRYTDGQRAVLFTARTDDFVDDNSPLAERLRGYILLEVEQNGEAWYVEPRTRQRYYLADGSKAFQALRLFGLGITTVNLDKIPIGIEDRLVLSDADGDGLDDKLEEAIGTSPFNVDSDGDGNADGTEVSTGHNPTGSGRQVFDAALTERLKGYIVLQVESRGEAWYISPDDGKRYYLKDGAHAYSLMRFKSLGITTENISKIQTHPQSPPNR